MHNMTTYYVAQHYQSQQVPITLAICMENQLKKSVNFCAKKKKSVQEALIFASIDQSVFTQSFENFFEIYK